MVYLEASMKTVYLTKHGRPDKAFEFREELMPVCKPDEIRVRVAASGLNFADVMVRKNLYDGAPKLPAVIGFDAVGWVDDRGSEVHDFNIGDRVAVLSKFGAYAEYLCTPCHAAVKIPSNMDLVDAVALPVQYLTAYYAAAELVTLRARQRVLIHAGAGGLGRALIEWCLYKGCEVFSTAGSTTKINLLKQQGVHHPILYTEQDFVKCIQQITEGKGVDVVFDGIGGANARKSFRCLSAGGRLVLHGASVFSSGHILQKAIQFVRFGWFHPLQLMLSSKSMIAINMMEMAREHPQLIHTLLVELLKHCNEGIFKPTAPHRFNVKEVAKAHAFLENRESHGKIALVWSNQQEESKP